MKLKAIKKIKQYKSFQDFDWQLFFKNEKFHNDVNILFGENGSGKSAICSILKNVLTNNDIFDVSDKNFGYKSFGNHKPREVILEFDSGEYNFNYISPLEKGFKVDEMQRSRMLSGDFWDKKLNTSDAILFFDKEFVSKNVHADTDGRKTDKNGQEQKSGRMIIEFDSKAINLRDVLKDVESEKNKQGEIVQKFNADNKDILSFTLLNKGKELFQRYKDKSKEEIEKIKNELFKEKKTIEKKIETDQSSQKIVDGIQNSIKEIDIKKTSIFLSSYEEYQSIFNFDLKEQIKIEAEKTLVEKLQLYKGFFEVGFEIRKTHPNQCPFCQSEQEKNIVKIIKVYNEIFDNTYKKQSQRFENDKQVLIDELEIIKQKINDLDLTLIFLELKKFDQNYKIKNIYSVDEEKLHTKPQTKKTNELIGKILKLKNPNKENVKSLYYEVKKEFKALEKFFEDIEKFVSVKNQIIKKFKSDNTDEKLQKRIVENFTKLEEFEQQVVFFSEKRINSQKMKDLKEEESKIVQKKFDSIKKKYEDAKTAYENYCSQEVFKKPLKKIEEYFKNFNFSFELKQKTEKAGNKTELPFAFRVLDTEGNERDLKDGLSEGELQVLSLCFFFAFLDIQKDRENKILIFDDPITSLDNNNLSCLVDLIEKEQKAFSQTFVFTHHRTFFKFLQKKFKTIEKDKNKGYEYNIIRNKQKYGGSFICNSTTNDIFEKLRNFESHLKNLAKNGGFSQEEKIIEYGQYLRYEIENFIKNNLLHWNKPNFGSIINCLIENKKVISKDELRKLKVVYSFCNWTTSHVGNSDDENSLGQLKERITEFVEIVK